MNEKLSKWGSIAEIISGVAVVVTLVFLILGIRENTEVTRAATYDRNIDSLNQSRIEMVKDPEIARFWHAFETHQTDSLDELERFRLGTYINIVFGNYEKAYFARKYGILGESECSRYARQICVNQGRLRSTSDLRADMETVVTDEFTDYMVSMCADGD